MTQPSLFPAFDTATPAGCPVCGESRGPYLLCARCEALALAGHGWRSEGNRLVRCKPDPAARLVLGNLKLRRRPCS